MKSETESATKIKAPNHGEKDVQKQKKEQQEQTPRKHSHGNKEENNEQTPLEHPHGIDITVDGESKIS